MAETTPFALLPLAGKAGTRLESLSSELVYAWDRTDSTVVRQWSLTTAATFGISLKRRAGNLFKLALAVTKGAAKESATAAGAFREDRLASHLGGRAVAAYGAGSDLVTNVKIATSQAIDLLRTEPRKAVPQLLTLVVTSIVVSGGVDGDGGAPDLDLMFGIGAHRSIFSHSILMGAALETGFLSLVQLVQLLHAKLPANHDLLWDALAQQAGAIGHAANTGASIGMSYHLLVDGLLQPAAYHGIGVPLPMEVHQAGFVANGVAEAVDTKHKPLPAGVGRPPTGRPAPREERTTTEQPAPSRSHDSSAHRPARVEQTPSWWMTAPAAELDSETQLHRRHRTKALLVDPLIAGMLADAELLIIERYGSWLDALARGAIRPLTKAQEQFVLAAKKQRAPETPHEQAWVVYAGLLGCSKTGQPAA